MSVEVGEEIPAWVVEEVSVEKMKTMAVLLGDPNPIHWDVEAVRAAGLGDRVINQGPTNQGYIVNMLLAWLGDPGRLRSVSVRFRANVYAGERVTAAGVITAIGTEGDERIAECDVWLRKDDGTDAITGSAVVTV